MAKVDGGVIYADKTAVVGGKSTGPCSSCRKLVKTTYGLAPYRIENGQIVPEVLQAFCNECGKVCFIPHSSVATIREFRQNPKHLRQCFRQKTRQPSKDLKEHLKNAVMLICQDILYTKAICLRHSVKYNGTRTATAIVPAVNWWNDGCIKSTRLLVTMTDYVVCSWIVYDDGTLERKTTLGIFRELKHAKMFYRSLLSTRFSSKRSNNENS
jgi:hypothetical protein